MSNKLQEGDTRKYLLHETMCGWFDLNLNDNNKITILADRHCLQEVVEIYIGDGEWEVDVRDDIDEFYVTGIKENYLFEGGDFSFCPPDIYKFFGVENCDDGWDFNGTREDECGIEDEDDNETRQKKWYDYKSKFKRLTSKDQFRISLHRQGGKTLSDFLTPQEIKELRNDLNNN